MNQLFTIYRIDETDALKISSMPDEPHNHDFEELIIGVDGRLEHFIDFIERSLTAPLVTFITKGKVHRVVPYAVNGSCSFWVIRFRSEFIPDTTFQLYSYYHDKANIEMREDACFNRLTTLCKLMDDEVKQPSPDYSVIQHLLSALFAMIEAERRKNGDDDAGFRKTQSIRFKNFLKILEENYRRPEGVDFYAEKLFMSARNLNLICQNIMQKSVSEIIETRKLIEAKNLLVRTDKTISEIGFELGYNEKAYFTRVFKNKSGQTPSEFREEMRKLLS
ncbi:MAG TPA: helix-turn-helix transcriptional regulator [Lentimicrobium sp.]|nr:helix-turn-helix transcriptional regulator [Lentimicrobium sp.]